MREQRDETLRQTLIALEEQGWQTLSQGTGADFYQQNLTDHAVMVFPFGVLTREQSIEAIKAAPPWTSFRIEDPQVVRLSDDGAVLIYWATAQRAGQEPYKALMTSVFVKQDGSWKTGFHQQMPVSA